MLFKETLKEQAKPQWLSLSRWAAQTPFPLQELIQAQRWLCNFSTCCSTNTSSRPISAPTSHTIPGSSSIPGFQQPLIFLEVFTCTLYLKFLIHSYFVWNLNRSKNKSRHTQNTSLSPELCSILTLTPGGAILTSICSLQYSKPMSLSIFFTVFRAFLKLPRLLTGSWNIVSIGKEE